MPDYRALRYNLINHPVYKYQLARNFIHDLGPGFEHTYAQTEWASIDSGVLSLTMGYAWDGASGPAIDTVTFMRASVVHDALYQLIAGGHLPKNKKKAADKELVRIAKEDGMNWFRRQRVYWAVRLFGRTKVRHQAV